MEVSANYQTELPSDTWIEYEWFYSTELSYVDTPLEEPLEDLTSCPQDYFITNTAP